MREPRQTPGRSKQDYGTPPAFLEAVKQRLGIEAFAWDLAASPANAVCPRYFTEADNALVQPWPAEGWNWCNPPFGRIGPWVEKASREARERTAQTVMLVPAAVGSNWWRDFVHGQADVEFLNGRLTFVGCGDPFPKDCALLYYDGFGEWNYDVWNWRADPPVDSEAEKK